MESISLRLDRTLVALGNSRDQVAQTLKARGIRGVRNAVRMLNPVVRFVQESLLISNLGMDLINPKTFRITLPDGTKITTSIPQAITDFLDAFDQGAYPELEMQLEKV